MKKAEVKAILFYYAHTIEGGFKITSENFETLIEKLSTEHHPKTVVQKKNDLNSYLKHKGYEYMYYCSDCKLLDNNNFFVRIRAIGSVYPRTTECELSENELPDINKNENNNMLSFTIKNINKN